MKRKLLFALFFFAMMILTCIPAWAAEPHVYYRTRIESYGWIKEVSDGSPSGTTGESKRLEAIRIRVDSSITGNIEYRTHIQNQGWESTWKKNNAQSGAADGKSLRLEAIQIRLTGNLASQYDIYYRVHIERFGWSGWAKNGAQCGSAGFSYRLESIEIKLVAKGGSAPGSTANSYYNNTSSVTYSTRVQSIGWQTSVRNGALAGTSGRSLRLEALIVALENPAFSGSIQYRTHVQNKGWLSWVNAGSMSGASQTGLRMEAVQIKLTGNMAKRYDIYYSLHVQNIGWMGWAKNGQSAGTAGYSYRVEAIKIKLVPKGNSAPGKVTDYFRQKASTPTPTPKPTSTPTPTPTPKVTNTTTITTATFNTASKAYSALKTGVSESKQLVSLKAMTGLIGQTDEYFPNGFKEGVSYTNSDYYPWKGGYYRGGFGCAGFAFRLSDEAFGTTLATMLYPKDYTSISQFKVGDILRLNYDTHSVIILQVDTSKNQFVVAEGNYNYSIHWGRVISFADFKKTGTNVLTRYQSTETVSSKAYQARLKAFQENYDKLPSLSGGTKSASNAVTDTDTLSAAEEPEDSSVHTDEAAAEKNKNKKTKKTAAAQEGSEVDESHLTDPESSLNEAEEDVVTSDTAMTEASGDADGEEDQEDSDTEDGTDEEESSDDAETEDESDESDSSGGSEDADADADDEDPDADDADADDSEDPDTADEDDTSDEEEEEPEYKYYCKRAQIIWDDEDDYDQIRPAYVVMTLYTPSGDVYGTYTVNADTDWIVSVYFPAVDDEGNLIDYSGYHWTEEVTNKQVEAPVGYTNVPEGSSAIEGVGVFEDGEARYYGERTQIRNVHRPHKEENVTARRIRILWDDDENSAGTRPSSVTAALNSGQKVDLSSANGWTGECGDLPVYYENTLYEYQWIMPEIDGYEVSLAELDTIWNESDEAAGEELILTYRPVGEDDDTQYTLWIRYYIRRNGQVTETGHPYVVLYDPGASYYEKTPYIPGYTADREVVSGTINGNMAVNVYYVPNTYTLTIRYRYADGTQAASTYTGYYQTDSTFSIASPSISGYRTGTPVLSGTMPARNAIYTIYYRSLSSSTGSDEEDLLLDDYPTPLGAGVGSASVNAGDCFE